MLGSLKGYTGSGQTRCDNKAFLIVLGQCGQRITSCFLLLLAYE
ncbi:hypothetical protein HNR34_000311 [Geobacillus subterraneus]